MDSTNIHVKFGQKYGKYQSYSKLPEMARKLVEKLFGFFRPPPKKNRVPKQKFGQKWKKSKLFKIAWNGEKIDKKRFL